jgi:hypothetical protein
MYVWGSSSVPGIFYRDIEILQLFSLLFYSAFAILSAFIWPVSKILITNVKKGNKITKQNNTKQK